MYQKEVKYAVFAVFKPLSVLLAVFLSNLIFTRYAGLGGRLEGMKGIPLPYFYSMHPEYADTYNRLSYFVNLFFWLLFFTILIDIILKWKKSYSKTYFLFNYFFLNAVIAQSINMLTMVFA